VAEKGPKKFSNEVPYFIVLTNTQRQRKIIFSFFIDPSDEFCIDVLMKMVKLLWCTGRKQFRDLATVVFAPLVRQYQPISCWDQVVAFHLLAACNADRPEVQQRGGAGILSALLWCNVFYMISVMHDALGLWQESNLWRPLSAGVSLSYGQWWASYFYKVTELLYCCYW
jgi:hypothetical protein